ANVEGGRWFEERVEIWEREKLSLGKRGGCKCNFVYFSHISFFFRRAILTTDPLNLTIDTHTRSSLSHISPPKSPQSPSHRPPAEAASRQQAQVLGKWRVQMSSIPNSKKPLTPQSHGDGRNRSEQVDVNLRSRRWAVTLPSLACLILVSPSPPMSMLVALARERRTRKNIPPEDYLTGPDGIKYYDLVQGTGPVAAMGTTVQVHFDCVYRGVTAISSRESKLLAGNRSISQPYAFKVGSPPGKERKRDFVDNPNGLFSAQAAPKPPPAMYKITEGMRVGGKRTVIVSPEVGYGQKGMNEIPPGATFDLNIELLRVEAPENKVS
ncbi:hypothetical protein V2J09_022576, partial [Rumex salicifolius]